MKKPLVFSRLVLALMVLNFAGPLLAGGEGLDMPEALDRKIPLDGLSGISLFFAKMYNDNLLLYAVTCTVLMAAIGMIIAFGTDSLLKAMGLETEKIKHEE